MKRLFTTVIILVVSVSMSAQCQGNAFSKTFEGNSYDQGHSISPAADGGYFLGAITDNSEFSTGQLDFLIIKFAADHAIEWASTVGTSETETGSFFCVTGLSDGGAAFAGFRAQGNSNRQLNFGKLNAEGQLLWNKKLAQNSGTLDTPRAIAEDSNGDIIIVGTCNQYISSSDGFFIRCDSNGNVISSEVYGVAGDDHFTGVTELQNGNHITYGSTEILDSFGATDPMICVFDSQDNLSSSYVYTTSDQVDQFTDIVRDSEGNLYATGYTDINNTDAFVMKISPNYTITWAKTFGGSNTERGSGIEISESGEIFVTALVNNLNGTQDVLITNWSPDGEVLWSKKLSFGGDDGMAFYGHPTMNYGANNLLVTAYTNFFGGEYDIALYLLDNCGNNGCAENSNTAAQNLNYDIESLSLQNVSLLSITNGNLTQQNTTLTTTTHCEIVSHEEINKPSICESKNILSFVIYDSFGRLILESYSKEDYDIWRTKVSHNLQSGIYTILSRFTCPSSPDILLSTEKVFIP